MESFFHLIVIFLLFISAVFIIWLYKLAHSRKIMTITLLIFETVGICVLLIPTGNINSPFIWYAINPVIIAASLLPLYYGWMILVVYIIITFVAFTMTGTPIHSEIFEENSHLFLVFILITLAVQLLTYVSKELARKNALLEKQQTELAEMNSKLNELLLFEEQNRIANEIHDSVSQRLFSIVYAIHALKRNPDKENLNEQLNLIEQCSMAASQELRELFIA